MQNSIVLFSSSVEHSELEAFGRLLKSELCRRGWKGIGIQIFCLKTQARVQINGDSDTEIENIETILSEDSLIRVQIPDILSGYHSLPNFLSSFARDMQFEIKIERVVA